jgi:hypothetical protein
MGNVQYARRELVGKAKVRDTWHRLAVSLTEFEQLLTDFE